MKLKHLVAAMAVAMSGAAQADVNLGTIGTSAKGFGRAFVNFGSAGSALGAFTDHYTFTLTSHGSAAGGAAVGHEWGSLDLSLNSVSLSGGTLGAKITDSTPLNFSFSNLGPGTYTLDVSGVLNRLPGQAGLAFYSGSIQSVASAAPEPEALALMVAGLAGVGFATSRRKRV